MLNKNNQIIAILSFCLCIITLTSCDQDNVVANGPMVTENLSLNDFDGVELDCSADINITQGDVQSVSVRGNANIIANLEREVVNGVWKVDLRPGNYNYRDLTITITVPSLDLIKIDGSGDINVGDFETDKMDIKIDGSGDVEFYRGLDALDYVKVDIDGSGDVKIKDLQTDELDCAIDGSGDIALEGRSNDTFLKISGSGDIKAFNLNSNQVEVDLNSSGDVSVRAEQRLEVSISGNGDVYYKGQPTLTTRINGSGRVINAN